MTRSDLDNETLDRRLRAAHAESIARISAPTMAQLHQRRHQALAGKGVSRFGWQLPAAFAAVLAVAVGLGLGLGVMDEPAIGATEPALVANEGANTLEDALEGLDQNPDFYAWLASSDADLLAME